MTLIAELVEEFDSGKLRINCDCISQEDAEKLDEVLNQFSKAQMEDDDYIRDDGTADFAGYIMYYYDDYPYLGIGSEGNICMWRHAQDSSGEPIRSMDFPTFLEARLIEDVPTEGFDEIFE